MTTISYAGITILDVLTEDIDQSVIYDSTDTDPIGKRVRATFRGTVHLHAPVTHGYGGAGSIAGHANAIADAMMQPRRAFLMVVDGVTFFDIRPGASDTSSVRPGVMMRQNDINNGPRPSLKILDITPGAMKVQFTIEFVVANCPNSSGSGVLNLRFWIADDVDGDNWLTVRTYHGRVRLAHSNLNPHAFRGLVVPVLVPGFQRKRISIQGSPNGLELEFTITDQEISHAAPGPASNWDGYHIVSSPMPGGATFDHEVHVMLEAPSYVGQTELLKLAAKILDAKLHLNEQQRDNDLFLLRSTFKADLKHNRIEANAACRTFTEAKLINVGEKELGKPLTLAGYDPHRAAVHHTTASTAGLFLSAIQTPCNPARMPQVPVDRVAADADTRYANDTEIEVSETPLTPYDNKYSGSHQRNIYTFYNTTSEYSIDEGVIALPVGKSSRGQGPTALIQLYQGQATRVLRVDAERLNAWPELPAPESFTDQNGIIYSLLRHRPMPNAPILSGDGRKTLNSVAYEMTYAMSRKPTAQDSLPVGRVPLRALMANESNLRNMPATVFISPGSAGSIS